MIFQECDCSSLFFDILSSISHKGNLCSKNNDLYVWIAKQIFKFSPLLIRHDWVCTLLDAIRSYTIAPHIKHKDANRSIDMSMVLMEIFIRIIRKIHRSMRIPKNTLILAIYLD